VLVAAAGCAGKRIVDGVYHSPKGYRVAVPGPDWQVVESRRADLELRHRGMAAGILVNAACQPETVRRSFDLLQLQLLAGLRDRVVKEEAPVALGARSGVRARLEGRLDGARGRVEVESYVVKSDRCVYDLLYVAPPGAFEAGRGDFRRVVDSLEAG
jgi:hypothetical protein